MRDHLVIYLNGQRCQVDADRALQPLSQFLRCEQHSPLGERLTGTKIACAEGDCGACTVLVGGPSADGGSLEYRSVDSCIAFVFQMDCRHVVTVEGLRAAGGLTDVQAAMVDCHGSQCGFCTPGFVMAMHGMVEQQRNDGCLKSPTDDNVRVGLSGNLCRCTGYLQIMQAAMSLELESVCSLNDLFDARPMLEEFGELQVSSVYAEGSSNGDLANVVAIPRSVNDLLEFRADLPEARLVAGATDLGVQHNHGRYAPIQVISTSETIELTGVRVERDELVVGGAATWRDIDRVVAQHIPEFHQVLLRFGSPQVRHMGTMAGNLANASPIADSIPLHLVTETVLEVSSIRGTREINVNDFYQGYKQIDLAGDEVITSIRTPLPPSDVALKLYKISKRRDMDISTATAAFWLHLGGETIIEARVAVGGVGPVVVRLSVAEEFLQDKQITLDSMQAAGRIARDEIAPISDIRGSAAYRLQLVENLFAKCYHELFAAPDAVGA